LVIATVSKTAAVARGPCFMKSTSDEMSPIEGLKAAVRPTNLASQPASLPRSGREPIQAACNRRASAARAGVSRIDKAYQRSPTRERAAPGRAA
jgi:hypothetical protein